MVLRSLYGWLAHVGGARRRAPICCTVFVSSLDSCKTKSLLAGRLGRLDPGDAPGRYFLDGDASLFPAAVFSSLAGYCPAGSDRWLMDGNLCLVHSSGEFFHARKKDSRRITSDENVSHTLMKELVAVYENQTNETENHSIIVR